MYEYLYPNGLRARAREGGHINFSRPWQTEMKISPTCPFCSGSDEERELNVYTDKATGWRLRRNKFPAGPVHFMIMPGTCWEPDRLRDLGKLPAIQRAFSMACKEIEKYPGVSLQFVVHIGPSAGQNQAHLHWHLAQRDEVLITEAYVAGLASIFDLNPKLVIQDDGGILVGVGGIRAGECFIIPRKLHVDELVLAEVIDWLACLFYRKFKSKEGMTPDFSITLRFQNGFFYGVFIPTLSNWGSTEYLAIHEGMPVLLPWPHEVTAEHLKSK